jgi:tight adherence protein B
VQRVAVLAIDTSQSMAGTRIAEAKDAAKTFLDTVPNNVEVGIVTFNDSVSVRQTPSLDRAASQKVLDHLTLARNTSLYDGVIGAIDAATAAGKGQRQIVILSDGKDTTQTSLASVLAKITQSQIKVDAIALGQTGDDTTPLQQMADAGNGGLISAADSGALTKAFTGEADLLARQVLVTATLPASQKPGDANINVSLDANGQTYSDSAFATVRTKPSPGSAANTAPVPVAKSKYSIPRSVVLAAVAAIGIGLVGLVFLISLTGPSRSKPASIEEQIQAYGTHGVQPKRAKPETGSPIDQARVAAEQVLANNKSLEARISSRLEAAGMALKPAEWILIHAAIAIGLGLLGLLLGGGSGLYLLLFLVLGAVGPWIYLGLKRSKRLKAFDAGLADTLQLMSGSLSAGLSLAQSIDTIVREGSEPITSEFKRVIVETRLGVAIEDALEGVGQRMNSKDFEWVVMAIRIQREVGGNLAELLLTVAGTLREREYLRRHVSALSAEGRLSCYVLGGLPPVFLLYLTLTKGSYVHPLYTTPIGLVMCGAMAVLLTVGIFWMSKVSKVDI